MLRKIKLVGDNQAKWKAELQKMAEKQAESFDLSKSSSCSILSKRQMGKYEPASKEIFLNQNSFSEKLTACDTDAIDFVSCSRDEEEKKGSYEGEQKKCIFKFIWRCCKTYYVIIFFKLFKNKNEKKKKQKQNKTKPDHAANDEQREEKK